MGKLENLKFESTFLNKINNMLNTLNSAFESIVEAPERQKLTYWTAEKNQKSYGQLISDIQKLTAHFKKCALVLGDRIGISTTDDYQFSVGFIAAVLNGLTAVPLPPLAKKTRADSILKKANVSMLFLDANLYETWELEWRPIDISIKPRISKKGALFKKLIGQKKSTDTATARLHYPECLDTLDMVKSPSSIPPDTVAYILFTSGTTSDPKGVIITHENLNTHLQTLVNTYGLTPQSRILNTLILYHVDGIVQGPLLSLFAQCQLIRPFDFSINRIDEYFAAFYKYEVSHFIAVPTMLTLMHRFGESCQASFATDSFKYIISVAAHIENSLWESFENTFNVLIVNVYGLTETVTGSFFCGPGEMNRKRGTVGKPIDCEAKIVDESDEALGDNCEGELLVKGAHVMTGYLDAPEANEEVFAGEWLRTGDYAIRDSNGFYRITGRKKNIVIVGGINIHPEEVTECLNAHPSVAEAVTLGMPCEAWGERLVSGVALANKSTTESELIAYCRQYLEPKKVPTNIHILPVLPKGPSGKILLNEVKKLIDNESIVTSHKTENISKEIYLIAAEVFNIQEEAHIHTASPATIEGWDSLSHLDFISKIEKSLAVKLSTSEIMRITSIEKAELVITERLGSAK